MVLGMSLAAFTTLHVLISIAALLLGIAFVVTLLQGKEVPSVTGLFLLFTIATSATGFLFPADTLLPSHITGIISLVVLAAASVARFTFRLAGHWRLIFIVTAIMSFYLNAFVFVVQAFLKVPNLHDLAPTGAEPPFAAAQGVVLVAFVGLGFLAVRRFHPRAVG